MNNVIIMEPKKLPPTRDITHSAIAAVLAAAGAVTFTKMLLGFPHNAPVESFTAMGLALGLITLSLILAISALQAASSVHSYNTLEEQFRNVTGDTRYQPYRLPARLGVAHAGFWVSLALNIAALAFLSQGSW